MTNIYSWNEIENEIKEIPYKHVLLGNGFSISYSDLAFNQKSILSNMPSLKDCADVIDIEECIQKTQDKISEELSGNSVPKKILDEWIRKELHKEFITSLFSSMPTSLLINEEYVQKLQLYKKFFNHFKDIYTLNYDPILYWMTLYFLNYGEQEYVECADLTNELLVTDRESKQYKKIEDRVEKSRNKCEKKIRGEIYATYLEDKDYYKFKLSCKDIVLIEKQISEAKKDSLIKWDKITEKIYQALETKKDEEEICKNESDKLDSMASTSFDTKLKAIETNKGNLKIRIADGFLGETWQSDNPQTIFYLHGAFHIFTNNNYEIIKIKATDKDKTNTMLGNINKELEKGSIPLTVLESSYENKIKKIKDSKYLKYCFDNFENIEGVLVTHGVSFMNSDKHIIDAINQNQKLNNIYIGIYGAEIPDWIQKAFEGNEKVKFFNTQNMFNIE